MRGLAITLLERVKTRCDAFNRPMYEEVPVTVQNVLISPETPGGEALVDSIDLSSRKAVYTLAIPKGDVHEWAGCRVQFFGQTFQVIGTPTEGIEHLIPGPWNRKVRVERIE